MNSDQETGTEFSHGTDKQSVLGFESLVCYQSGLKLFHAGYRLAQRLPDYERYNLADQLRRAVLSVVLNIAEGYGRYHYLDKLRFFYFARGSLCETLSAFICAHQAGYVDDEQMAWVREVEEEAEKALNGYVSYIRRIKSGKDEFGGRFIRDEEVDYHVDPPLVINDDADQNFHPDTLVP